jgi:hypothetical protein
VFGDFNMMLVSRVVVRGFVAKYIVGVLILRAFSSMIIIRQGTAIVFILHVPFNKLVLQLFLMIVLNDLLRLADGD